MPLRCLLFSSNEQMVQPVWPVLADLGIEGEYCGSAVDAVERVTTQLFQIVVTDWEDQPEAAFLLKTARDLKAAQRPLILAIVGEDAKLPGALRAGANSVLVKPLRAEQVRDTLSTACQLLRAKQQPPASAKAAVPQMAEAPTPRETPEPEILAAVAAATGAVSIPASVTQSPEKTFRAGEFLTSASSAPGAAFDTETDNDVQKTLDQAALAEVDSLTELEPMASAVKEEEEAEAPEPVDPRKALTGWASLQARLTQPAPQPVEEAPAKSELLPYGETPSYGAQPSDLAAKEKTPQQEQSVEEAEAELFGYMPGGEGALAAQQPGSRRGKILCLSAFAIACVILMAVPRTRRSLQLLYRQSVHAAANWLNPPPAPLPQAVAQHDSFGQSGDEYKLPTVENIPDATTDPSQVRVLPVIDPTAKPEKSADTNGAQGPAVTSESSAADQTQKDQAQKDQGQTGQGQSAQGSAGQIKDSSQTSAGVMPESTSAASPTSAPSAENLQPVIKPDVPQPRLVASAAQPVAPPHTVSAASSTGIPSSLKSQMASSTPDASGNKPAEAAMSAIEPVNLPESAARDLLAQSVDPQYPVAAKASGQRGSVVLQVLVGRDGAVQEVKFLQGSLMFARAAIDAVRQWRFKPYSMNGRAVSVQSVITLNFRPPA